MNPPQQSSNPKLDLEGVLAALGIRADNQESRISYTIIRGQYGPRWLLPNRSKLSQIILGEWRPYGPAARVLWLGLRVAARFGALSIVPGTSQALLPANAGEQLLSHLGQEADVTPPIVLVGNSVATRKLLAFVESPSRGIRAVIKFPLTTTARASIRNEAETLSKLDGKHGAPRLLHFSEDTGSAMQQYLPGRLGSRRCKPKYIRLLIELVRTGEKISLRACGRRLAERLRSCPAYGENAATVDSALAYLDDDATVPLAITHGDFAPWNIKELPSGECALIDWELAKWDGIPLHDLCHFYYMQCLLFSPQKLFYSALLKDGSWRGYCRQIDLPPRFLPGLAVAFLLELLAGYWENDDPIATFGLQQIDLFLRHLMNPIR